MATFKSSERIVSAGRDLIYSRLNNPESFKGIADNVTDDLKQQVGNIRIDGDVITLEAKPVGDVSFRIANGVENEKVHLETVSSPFPLSIDVCLADGDAPETTNAHVEVKIDLNPILKTMLSKPMQDAAEKVADLIAVMPYK